MTESLENLVKQLKKNPKNSELRKEMALLLFDEGFEKEALEQLAILTEIYPDMMRVAFQIGCPL
jgi:thioredoxin-like negative regulator of GroEL